MASVEYLKEGFKRFHKKHFGKNKVLYDTLVESGQKPKIMVVGCCDSRVDPAIVLDSAPGDLFVIRNVANIVPPSEKHGGHHGTSAALEFGVCYLEVEEIIVLGHAHCGGILTLVENGGNPPPDSFIGEWMDLVEQARKDVVKEYPNKSVDELSQECEKRAILISLQNLMMFPWVLKRVDAGTLRIRGWYFDIEKGFLLEYDEENNEFINITKKMKSPLMSKLKKLNPGI